MKDKKQHWRCSLVMACMAIFWTTQSSMGLVVSEIMYHPADDGEKLEFIELYNNRAVFEDLSGYAFTDGIQYEFEPGTIINSGEYLVVARDPAAIEAAYSINGVLGPLTGRLDNDGERIVLSNNNGEIIISLRYDDERPWPVSPDGAGHSLILARQGGDPAEASIWSPSMLIGGTPGMPDEVQSSGSEGPTLVTLVDVGHPGRYFKGTQEPSLGPDGQAATTWTELAFNDDPFRTGWLEGPSGYGYSNASDELQYIGTQLNDMRGNYISVYARLRFTLSEVQIDDISLLEAEVHYDDAFVLYLNGIRVADAGGISGSPPRFDQGGSQASDGLVANVNLSNRINLLVPGTNVLAIQIHNASLSSSSDCVGAPILRAVIEAQKGAVDPRARVVINEVLANSDAATGADRIELYNPGLTAVDLGNVYLSDDEADLLKYKISNGIVMQPGDFWTVSEGTQPDEFGFGLSASGETIYVTAATNDTVPIPVRVLDAVNYGTMEPEVAFGRFPDGSDSFAFLTSATFGGPNARPVINDIVINEIMYHHGTRDERYEYIELYNRGSDTVVLAGWSFTDGIGYTFETGTEMQPDSYIVVAKDPNFISGIYNNLNIGTNLVGPYSGGLDDHSERIRLSYPYKDVDPLSGDVDILMIMADEVTYYDGGRWPSWADGQGASLELRDPDNDNDAPDAWADSDESGKTVWEQFSFTINSNDSRYRHDQVNIFELLLLNRGEVLIDDIELIIGGASRLNNDGFESGESNWRFLGNHVRSFVTTTERHSGARSLHLIATGHGDPGANRINQSLSSVTAGTVTFRGWARWLRGTQFLLLRTSRASSPTQPPRPAHSFELTMPLDLGTPGSLNTAYISNRGPDILDVQHEPVIPASGEPIVVTACVTDTDGVGSVTLIYRSEGSGTLRSTPMLDNGSGDDLISGDGIYTGTIPGASSGTMRAFYIESSDGSASTRFPTNLDPSAEVPDRTCLVRVGDSLVNTPFATYRVWMSNDVIDTFRSRPNLSNELMDCTFVYNNTEVFYNCGIRHRGSPFLRNGSGREPYPYVRHGFRIDFNPDQKFRGREEINLDGMEESNRGPLQERASYWFYKEMGLQFSMQEYVRLIMNGRTANVYEDVQKVDGDYIDKWFPDDNEGYIHKIDDYFEYSADGTGFSNLDEGLKSDSSHPRLKETYRWGFEKRSHRENDNWDHIMDFAAAFNTPSSSTLYESNIESVIHPEYMARVLAIRHAVGDWDSYGYRRGKNNLFYYALPEGKWYLLPWDIDFTLGSGDGSNTNLFSVNANQFPEVDRFLNYPKYQRMYLQAYAELVNGPWQTSYGTADPPTEFDKFLDDAANALIADGQGSGRRDGIKDFVRRRRSYILTQIPSSLTFEITTNGGGDFFTSASKVTITGVAPIEVAGISVNGTSVPAEFSGNSVFDVKIEIAEGPNLLNLQGLNGVGNPVTGATDSITVTRIMPCVITSVAPNQVYNDGTVQLTINGSGFEPGSDTSVALTLLSEEVGFDALYVQSTQAFDRIDAATLMLDDLTRGVGNPIHAVHEWINLWNTGGRGLFTSNENRFAPPFQRGADNFAVRFTGYIFAPSPGVRYFGVSSDDGFSLWINGQLVGEYADSHNPATTDVTQNRTDGTMTFDFPAAGSYYLILDYFENNGGEEIEFFQTDSVGADRRLINIDSELVVFRDNDTRIEATNIVVVDENTITCQVDLNGAEPGVWNVVVTPEYGDTARCVLPDAVEIISR
ncbi:lamin tail domain-containing protein [Planctomycetota bacterium]